MVTGYSLIGKSPNHPKSTNNLLNKVLIRTILKMNPPWLLTILLLIASNIFMTFAWYGHLKFKTMPLVIAILISWALAFFEYCLQVPANRLGHSYFSAAQLKTIQEVITFAVFIGFSVYYLKEPIRWNHLLGFSVIILGAYIVLRKW
jgi:uncharacterized protein (DUF486 family)